MNEMPGNVFLYDSLDRVNPNQQQPVQSQRFDYRIIVAGVFGFIVLVAALILLHTMAWGLYVSEQYKALGFIILLCLYFAIGFVLCGCAVVLVTWLWNYANKVRLINVFQHQTTQQQLEQQSVINSFFDVAKTRADKSIFAGVQNLTYSPRSNESNVSPVVEDIANEPLPLEQVQTTYEKMRDMNLVGRSGNSLFIGFSQAKNDEL